MELHQVRYFLAVSRTLNFTRAAEACHVTQPALTRAIQRLEDELGGPLLHRERSLTQLTELGRAMLPHLQAAVDAAESARQLAAGLHRQDVASLHVGLATTIPATLVGVSLAELVRRFPTLEIALSAAPQEKLVEALLHGDLHAAVLVDTPDFPERLHRWRLLEEGFHVVFPPAHRFAATETLNCAALDGETLLEAECCNGLSRLGITSGTPLHVRHRGSGWDHVQHMAAAGLGIALLPASVPLLPPLMARPLAEPELLRSVVLAVVSGRRHSAVLDGFLKLNRARSFTA